jgi:transposase
MVHKDSMKAAFIGSGYTGRVCARNPTGETMATTRTASKTRSAPKQLRLAPGETVHIGVDVHKHSFHVAIHSDRRGLLATWVQPAEPAALSDSLAHIRPRIARIVYEAGPTGFGLARRLTADGYPVEVIAPSKVLAAPGPDTKTDQLDCRRLALFSVKGLLSAVRIPTEQEEADRQVLRLRDQLVRKARSIQQQIKAFLLVHGIPEPEGLANWSTNSLEALRGLELRAELRFCLDVMLDELTHANTQVDRVTRELRRVARTDRHRAAAELLQTVPGVGPITAMTFRLEVPEPQRFEDDRQVARMLGLAPQVRESGERRRSGRILKSGNPRLRTVLVEAAWRWVASDEGAGQRYRKLVGNTGSGKKAIVGMARRLGILLWRLSTRNEPYRAQAS